MSEDRTDPPPSVPVPQPPPVPDSPSPPRDPLRVAAKPRRIPPTPFRVLATVGAVFVSIFLFLRVFAVEPFGVPTGSMAPTLAGNHREAPCARCGYPVRVGSSSAGGTAQFHDAPCPNCGKKTDLTRAREISGDRLLVDKNVYSLRRPRRWEVAVFRCAADLSKPYVKRVVGLPGEVITIADGEVYADGGLLRKGLAEAREARILVFDLNFAPDPGGWSSRWLVYPPGVDRRLPRESVRPPVPADASVLRGGDDPALVLDASAGPEAEVWLEYRHWNLDERKEEPVSSWNSYDGAPRSFSNIYPAHDFMLECQIEVEAVSGTGLFAARLFDGSDSVNAEISVGPKAKGQANTSHEGHGGLASASGVSVRPGSRHRLEFAFVDRRVSLALDGKPVVAPADLPAVPKRGEVRQPLQLGARGCRLVVRDLKIYRDVHYTQAGRHGTRLPARLGPTEYFMLGDNSANSQDSREWPHPGVPESDFIGKPFLIHQPLRLARTTAGGRERVFQTLDWSRLRWLH